MVKTLLDDQKGWFSPFFGMELLEIVTQLTPFYLLLFFRDELLPQLYRDYFICQYKDPVINQISISWIVIRVCLFHVTHLGTVNVFFW